MGLSSSIGHTDRYTALEQHRQRFMVLGNIPSAGAAPGNDFTTVMLIDGLLLFNAKPATLERDALRGGKRYFFVGRVLDESEDIHAACYAAVSNRR